MHKLSEQELKIFFHQIEEEWNQVSDMFPEFLEKIDEDKKQANQSEINRFSDELRRITHPTFPRSKEKSKKKMLRKVHEFLRNEEILELHTAMNKESIEAFEQELLVFIRRAKEFAPELKPEEILQAVRNYMVYAVFAELCGVPQCCKSSSFGYSMLYPVNDNYIDNETLSKEEKERYNQFIEDKVLGKEPEATSDYDQKTGILIQYVLEEYENKQDENMRFLLHHMLKAQRESVRQQQSDICLSYLERFDISVYKGCISVLIDRYLVDAKMTDGELKFFLAYGFILQLADDLQDIITDKQASYQTLFTLAETKEEVERTLNRLFHFTRLQFEQLTLASERMREFIENSCYQLFISSLVGVSETVTEEYLLKLEQGFCVEFDYLNAIKKGFSKEDSESLETKFNEMFEFVL